MIAMREENCCRSSGFGSYEERSSPREGEASEHASEQASSTVIFRSIRIHSSLPYSSMLSVGDVSYCTSFKVEYLFLYCLCLDSAGNPNPAAGPKGQGGGEWTRPCECDTYSPSLPTRRVRDGAVA